MKKLLFKNLGLKIIAVLLSVFLWILATSRGLSEIALDVPIEFKNIPPGLELTDRSVKAVSLKIKGQERDIRNIRPSDLRVWIDLSKAKKGEGIYSIKGNMDLPRAVTATNITPSNVKVLLEESITETVQVMPVIVGNPERGFYIKSISVLPQTVVIEGAGSKVKKVNKIKTEPLDITGFKKTFTQDLKLDITGKNIRTRTKDVKVKIVIAREKK